MTQRVALLLLTAWSFTHAQNAGREPFNQPPPTPDWRPLDNPIAVSDLNGTWEADQGNFLKKISILQVRDAVVLASIDREGNVPPDHVFSMGVYNTPRTISAKIQPYGQASWFRMPIRVLDDDHIQTGGVDLPVGVTLPSSIFHRASRGSAQDIRCDPHGPPPLSAHESAMRALIYSFRGELSVAACWSYMGAIQGDVHSQAAFGSYLYLGRGVARDTTQALFWIQRSAMQGDILAAAYLVSMFRDGIGVPKSAQRQAYWTHRGEANTSPEALTGGAIPPWALQTSGPCDPANPPRVNAQDALIKGRVAYQARALEIAACWFGIGANQGNVKSKTYLGILNAFGLGVPKNPEKGFAYMLETAKAGDLFAKVYLANFYKLGIGTPRDEQTAFEVISSLPDTMAAFDAYNDVQGINAMESAAGFLNLFAAVEGKEDCEADNERQRRLYPGIRPQPCPAPSSDSLAGPSGAAHHTVEHPEEIYPEFRPYPH